MQNKNIDPTLAGILITAISTIILRLRIKINRSGQDGIYQFFLDFQKQLKEDPELLDNMMHQLDESKMKTAEKSKK